MAEVVTNNEINETNETVDEVAEQEIDEETLKTVSEGALKEIGTKLSIIAYENQLQAIIIEKLFDFLGEDVKEIGDTNAQFAWVINKGANDKLKIK